MAEREQKSLSERAKKWGIIGALVGSVVYFVSSSGVALAVGIGGGAAYAGGKYLEGKGK